MTIWRVFSVGISLAVAAGSANPTSGSEQFETADGVDIQDEVAAIASDLAMVSAARGWTLEEAATVHQAAFEIAASRESFRSSDRRYL
jgi:hypothetical protein